MQSLSWNALVSLHSVPSVKYNYPFYILLNIVSRSENLISHIVTLWTTVSNDRYCPSQYSIHQSCSLKCTSLSASDLTS